MNSNFTRQLIVMSRTVFNVILVNCCLAGTLVASDSNGQTKSIEEIFISLKAKERALEEVLGRIEAKTTFHFSYYIDDLKGKKITVNAQNQSLANVLRTIARQTKLGFKRIDQNIHVILKGENTKLVEEFKTQQLDKLITGKVTSENGDGLPGVNIFVKGTTFGVITDVEGKYKINVPDDAEILVFSYVGYLAEEVEINDQSIINVTLAPNLTTLSEVVVVGFQTLKKENVAGSVSQVKSKDINIATVPTVSSALVGKIAGVTQRQSDGRPGASASLRIRNFTGDPLFIIDGVQKDQGQFNNLDVNDIESISVLKDAEAAVYGIRGANGVVIVTTKSGKDVDGVQFNARYYTGKQEWTKFPQFADAPNYVQALVEDEMNRTGTTTWDKEEFDKWQAGTEKGYQSFDWSTFIDPAPINYYHIDAQGGSDKINFYTGLSFIDQEGTLADFEFERVNLQFNTDAKLTENLTISTRVNARQESRLNPGLPWGDDLIYPLWALSRNVPTQRPYANDNPNFLADNGSRTFLNFAYLTYDKSGIHTNIWKVFQGNSSLEYKFPETSALRGLKAKVTGGYYNASNAQNSHEYTFDTFTYRESTDTYERTGGNDNDWRDERTNFINETTLQTQLSYDNIFGDHEVAAVLAAESYERTHETRWLVIDPPSNFLFLYPQNTEFRLSDHNITETATLGYSGRLNYSYKGKYIAQFVGRRDGSFRFPKKDRWGFFPSYSLAYRISEEDFFKNSPVKNIVSDLKIRISSGKLGSDALGGYANFAYLPGYTFGQNGSFIGTFRQRELPFTVIRDRGIPVTTISWIVATTQNVGIDFGLFDNQLTGTFDVFRRKQEGLTARRNDVVIPNEVGINVPLENLESDQTSGFDMSLNYTTSINDLQLSLGGVLTYGRTKVTDRYNPRFGNSWEQYRNGDEGRWRDRFWVYEAIGQFQTQEEIDNHPIELDGNGNQSILPGDIIFKDLNGDNRIDEFDRRPLGYGGGNPNFSYGLTTQALWKGFDLVMVFQGAGQYSTYLNRDHGVPLVSSFGFGNGNIAEHLLDRWHREDPFNPDSDWIPGKYPATRVNGHGSNNRRSTFWMTKARYLRLRNIEIGYSLPQSVIERVGIRRARIFANGTNIFTITNVEVRDPEVTEGGVSGAGQTYPQTKSVNIGIDLSF
ncbi:TonB-dependent receptor [Fulvivirgaceae bacterium BMA10]|uniref:TonB-dependent receptor n=1 Tax=Splendidivirga corallicola TaxID=3051826 RepID=A0ABT8KN67_9BACT|nr:TonB-dependent receptor [Fulvivirgaceae bacterium BMA10]